MFNISTFRTSAKLSQAINRRSLISLVFIILFFVLAFYNLVPSGGRPEAFALGFRLFFSSAIITGIGALSASLFRFPLTELCSEFRYAFYLLWGELFCVSYLYFRSAINQLINFTIPVSAIDYGLILLVLIPLWITRKERNLDSSSKIDISAVLPFGTLLLFVFVIVTHRELPREIMLSSDPDQHAYFVKQIFRLGTIPFHQSYFGPLSFKYPSGLAALNFVWGSIGWLDPRDIVTVQPIIQTILGIFLIFTYMFSFAADSSQKKNGAMIGLLVILVVYWSLLPFGHQRTNFHLEGTARISSLGILALTLFLFIDSFNTKKDRFSFDPFWYLFSFLPVFFLLLNPALAIAPAILFGISTLAQKERLNPLRLFLLLIPAALLLCDPYYLDIFAGIIPDKTAADVHLHTPLAFSWEKFCLGLIGNFSSLNGVYSISGIMVLPQALSAGLVCLLFGISLASYQGISSKFGNNRTLAFLAIPTILFLIFSLLMPLLEAISGPPILNILSGYFRFGIQLLMYLWVFLALSNFASIFLIRTPNVLVLPSIAAITIGFSYIRDFGNEVGLSPRFGWCGAMGCVYDSDKQVLQKLEQIFADYRKSHDLSFKTVPKILLPNRMDQMGKERWLFPAGAARILPMYDTFPAAFFYYQGSSSYTYKNYRKNVCGRLNIQFLKDRNIRYLFLPKDRKDICVKGLKDLIANGEKIIVEGDSMLIRLF